VDDRLRRIDQMRVVNNFLRKTLGRIDVVKRNKPNDPGLPRIQFVADAGSISWIGIMPARHGVGGRYFFHLAAEETKQGKALVLRYAPWMDQAEFPEWTQSESHVLVTSIESFMVEAEGLPVNIQTMPSNWPRSWNAGWPVRDALPQRLRLTLIDQKDTWPPLVITVVPASQSQTGSSDFVTGGSAR